jgi:hypothetical protein
MIPGIMGKTGKMQGMSEKKNRTPTLVGIPFLKMSHKTVIEKLHWTRYSLI